MVRAEADCAASAQDAGLRLLEAGQRLSPTQYQQLPGAKLLVDVRPEPELQICSLPEALHVPLAALHSPEGRQTVLSAAEHTRAGSGTVTGEEGSLSQAGVTLCHR